MIELAIAGLALVALPSCDHSNAQQDPHSGSPHKPHQAERSRPTNQVAVMTVWAEAKQLEPTARFYEDFLGLRRVGTSTEPYILDIDGTFLPIMEGSSSNLATRSAAGRCSPSRFQTLTSPSKRCATRR
jgi:hypothetical protein